MTNDYDSLGGCSLQPFVPGLGCVTIIQSKKRLMENGPTLKSDCGCLFGMCGHILRCGLCYRRDPPVLVGGQERGEADLLGRLPSWSAAMLLQPERKLHGHELLLQLRRKQGLMVTPKHAASAFPPRQSFIKNKYSLQSFCRGC